ncbi:MAG: 30S ribosomal protein S16 [Candidatus Gracilibacteria bacterium]|nr:30S ribosomal protein S16 [Candidatus Gracilibacteria bacterium]
MLKIRLSRAGKKNSPFFRLVLTEHAAAAKHGYKEVLGFFNPLTKEFKVNDLEKIKKYISNGAQFSEKVEKLMKVNNIAL